MAEEEEIQLPDQAFFDACAEGNEEHVRSVIRRSGEEFEWGRLFQFRVIVQEGAEIEVLHLHFSFF